MPGIQMIMIQGKVDCMREQHIEYVALSEVIPYANNPRNNTEEAVEKVAASIREFGFRNPIVVDKENTIICGHTRYQAAKRLKLENVPVIRATDLTPAQIRAYRIADNKVSEYATWDFQQLSVEIERLSEMDFDLSLTGFDESELSGLRTESDGYEQLEEQYNEQKASLAERFIVPPFSILDTRQGYWQERKTAWKSIIKSDAGRGAALLGNGLKDLAKRTGSSLTGTSIFDPVLCEILLNWFCPKGGKVLDPFAGGSVRGLVSVMMGNSYTGIDLSEQQIAANRRNYAAIANCSDLDGNPLQSPNWICADSRHIDTLVTGQYDFLLTCPPYADLEVYSDHPQDLSNLPYEQFIEAYTEIIQKSVEKLRENAFAAIVVGEVRDKKGYYRGFVPDTIAAFRRAGMQYYNECILIEQVATAAIRAGKQFEAGRKVVKTHQNVLIFVKGEEKQIMKRLDLHAYPFDESRQVMVRQKQIG